MKPKRQHTGEDCWVLLIATHRKNNPQQTYIIRGSIIIT